MIINILAVVKVVVDIIVVVVIVVVVDEIVVIVGKFICFSLMDFCNMIVKIIGRPAITLSAKHTVIGREFVPM